MFVISEFLKLFSGDNKRLISAYKFLPVWVICLEQYNNITYNNIKLPKVVKRSLFLHTVKLSPLLSTPVFEVLYDFSMII
jgi:hypothetical protein